MTEEPELKGVSLEKIKEVARISPFPAFLGAEVTAFGEGFAEVVVPIRKELTQWQGYAYGAVVGAVADIVCAWAAASIMGYVVTSEYKINFMAPAAGEKLVGRGYVIKASTRQAICRADVFAVKDGQEKQAATALATIMPVNGQ